PPNWDSYGAKKPNSVALVKAVNYIVEKLAPLNLEVFFTTPTTDGDIVVELKNNSSSLEIIFSGEEGGVDSEIKNKAAFNLSEILNSP
ncbi:MAG TPA: hypothetical protein PLS50_08550, partial [Candidatus Dojkabacteria bacterium]|nr:hypothetical protein [Candidatus Dojkabacteria bacterium]